MKKKEEIIPPIPKNKQGAFPGKHLLAIRMLLVGKTGNDGIVVKFDQYDNLAEVTKKENERREKDQEELHLHIAQFAKSTRRKHRILGAGIFFITVVNSGVGDMIINKSFVEAFNLIFKILKFIP